MDCGKWMTTSWKMDGTLLDNGWKLRGKWVGNRWTLAGKWVANDGMHGQRMEMHGKQLDNVWKIEASFFKTLSVQSQKPERFFEGGGRP